MNIFATEIDSHNHSLRTLNSLANYNDFMDSLTTIVDMGCGVAHDLSWWATRTYMDENDAEKPYNYNCIGVDLDVSRIAHAMDNLKIIKADMETVHLTDTADLILSHDSFRYAVNPLGTLKHWNSLMSDNGMIVLTVPQTINIAYNKLTTRALPLNYYHYTITNLLYMLAVNGFDCHDGQFVKYANDPWVHCVAYKSEHAPLDPKTTTWYDLVERNLLPDTAAASINRYGYIKQEELQTHWLDRQFCDWSQV